MEDMDLVLSPATRTLTPDAKSPNLPSAVVKSISNSALPRQSRAETGAEVAADELGQTNGPIATRNSPVPIRLPITPTSALRFGTANLR